MTGNTRWTIDNRIDAVDAILTRAPVVPVLSIANLEDAVPLARVLVDAGLPVLEVTLRTGVAREAIRAIAAGVPNAIVGAGTVLTAQDLDAVAHAGAKFAIAPGCTETMYAASHDAEIPFIPAIATASELMRGLEHGHARFKFFPAESVGGIGALRSFAGPFAQAKFCPTGGIDAAKARDYLRLPNVITVGGSWMVPNDALAARDWNAIGMLAAACLGTARLTDPHQK
jgi:2-dehydro-3-deoxyphosphogluconate aldolase/(4S)-4-hydroxy-2-oxoglutarate aldolase